MQDLTGINRVRGTQPVALGRGRPAGTVDPPQTLARGDHVGRADDVRADAGSRGTAVADLLPGPDAVDVAAWHAPRAGRRAAGTAGDRAHGVAGADHNAVAGIARWRRDATTGQSPVNYVHDRRIVGSERLSSCGIVAEVAADGARGQSVQVDRRSCRGLWRRLDVRQARRALVVWVRVLAPCRAVAAEPVQVEASGPAAETAVARVLAHDLAARSDVPRGCLVSGDEVRRVLCDPDAAVQLRLHAGDLPVPGVHRVDDRVHARQTLDLARPAARPLLVAPCRVVRSLPVEDQDAPAHVSAHVVDEEPGFGLGVAAARVMVDAGLLAAVDGAGELTVSVGVDAVGQASAVHAAGTPCGADDDEIGRHGRGVDAALPVRDVVPVHVGHRRRGERHGDCDGERCQRRAPASAWFHVLRFAFVEDVQIPLLPAPKSRGK